MTYIWNASFRCDECDQVFTEPVHFLSHIDEPLPEEKSEPLEVLKRLHYVRFHTDCIRCSKNIKPGEYYEITDTIDRVLCEGCAKGEKK